MRLRPLEDDGHKCHRRMQLGVVKGVCNEIREVDSIARGGSSGQAKVNEVGAEARDFLVSVIRIGLPRDGGCQLRFLVEDVGGGADVTDKVLTD